jgi:mannose-binding lectin 1
MRLIPLSSLLPLTTLAQDILKDFSFGHDRGISPNSFAIPGWTILGEGHVPQLLSDKVILTPPYGDNKRGALWTESTSPTSSFSVSLSFRAGGPERASGNLALWYAANGATAVSTSSIYTVGKFDGLALVIDTASGQQKIRGFLNDGSTDYRSHPNVDSLAFAHCNYNYRNLGRASTLLLRSSPSSGLEVLIDDKLCFTTSKVTLPANYNFGLTAASGGPPDSFEAFKFVVKGAEGAHDAYTGNNQQQQQYVREEPNRQKGSVNQAAPPAAAQLDTTELLSQLQLLLSSLQTHDTSTSSTLSSLSTRLSSIESKLTTLTTSVNALSNQLSSLDHSSQFSQLSRQLTATQQGISEHLPGQLRGYIAEHTPRVGFMIFSFIAFQMGLVAVYVVYKRRRWGAPKKYL